MAQRNDDELAFYLADLVRTAGHISDQERDWYLTQLSVAQPFTGPKHINDLWQAYWLSLGISQGSVNDMAYKWLVSLGIPAGHINDMWHAYFEGLVYPAILDSALVWLKDSGINQSGGFLTSWANQGTGGAVYDLNTITGSIPIVPFNSINSLQFNGNSYVLPSTPTTLLQPSYIYAVYKLVDLTTQNVCVVYDSYANANLRNALELNKVNDDHQMKTGLTINTTNGSLTINPEVSQAFYNGATSDLLISPNITVSGNVGTQSLEYISLGAHNNKGSTNKMIGLICELIIFNGVLPNASEQANIFQHLSLRYGA